MENEWEVYNVALAFLRRFRDSGADSALRYPASNLRFHELQLLSFRAFGLLRPEEGRVSTTVGIWAEKTPEAFAVAVACLLRGIPYVFIDPDIPGLRFEELLRQARFSVFVGPSLESDPRASELQEKLSDIKSVSWQQVSSAPPADESDVLEAAKAIDGSTIAYIMFTSGSTGKPKGVAVTHANLLSFARWGARRFRPQRQVFANVSPLYFDNSVFDLFVGLLNGATLAPISKKDLENATELCAALTNAKITVWFSVPSLIIYLRTLRVFTLEFLPALEHLVFGGEGFPKPILKEIYEEFGPTTEVVNVYGPTECTCIATSYVVSSRDFFRIDDFLPLGKVNENFDFIIDYSATEIDERGELILMGPNVSAGYIEKELASDESFFSFSDETRILKPAYRTGDLVSLSKDGLLFHGRLDNQIKHLGYRVELEEIENAIDSLPGVVRSCVVYERTRQEFGEIKAAVVVRDKSLGQERLKQYLLERLPHYMVPRDFLFLDELPTNSNGKVSRNRVAKLLLARD